MTKENIENIIIIGSGPAGLTAAIYAARAELKPLLVEGETFGGQLIWTTEVENFPGFPKGIMGPDLMLNMKQQAENHGTRFVSGNVSKVDFSKKPFKVFVGEKEYLSKSVIIATGARANWLDVPGVAEFRAKGVTACATCDGPFFKGQDVLVVGGGDTAMEESSYLSKLANVVYLVHRKDSFRASKTMQERVLANPKIKIIFNSELKEVYGTTKVEGVKILNTLSNEILDTKLNGVFMAIGHTPDTDIFKGQVELDEKGFVKVVEHTKTSVEGVFTAGDVHDFKYRQAITAAGFGCMAALEAERWLSAN